MVRRFKPPRVGGRRLSSQRIAAGLVLAAIVGAFSAEGAGDRLRPAIERLEVQESTGTLTVSYRLIHALSDESMERVHSGLPLTYKHVVEALSRRSGGMWPSRVLARVRVETSADYDSLTRQYRLTRRVELRVPKDKATVGEETHTTESADEMRRWMTELSEVPLLVGDEVEDRERVRVRVESTLGRRYVMLLFPSRISVSAEHRVKP